LNLVQGVDVLGDFSAESDVLGEVHVRKREEHDCCINDKPVIDEWHIM